MVETEPTAEVLANCEPNNITTQTFDLGSQAVVLVANGASDYLQCLTTDQLITLWQAPGTVDAPVTTLNRRQPMKPYPLRLLKP